MLNTRGAGLLGLPWRRLNTWGFIPRARDRISIYYAPRDLSYICIQSLNDVIHKNTEVYILRGVLKLRLKSCLSILHMTICDIYSYSSE